MCGNSAAQGVEIGIARQVPVFGETDGAARADHDAGMAHTLDVTTVAPPYAHVPKNIPVTPPQNMRSVPGLFALTGKVPARRDRHAHLSKRSTAWFRLAPGTYYYVCAMPGHAQHGMYGTLTVTGEKQ
ncbi:MAG: sulfocyanin-like copper-binding protein [Gammaproteobacteria bacterium]